MADKMCEIAAFAEPESYDDTVMAVLNRLDELRILALDVGDQALQEGLGEVFESFLKRYCDSKHAALNSQMRRHFQPPKLYMH
jgi:hypothetical protein